MVLLFTTAKFLPLGSNLWYVMCSLCVNWCETKLPASLGECLLVNALRHNFLLLLWQTNYSYLWEVTCDKHCVNYVLTGVKQNFLHLPDEFLLANALNCNFLVLLIGQEKRTISQWNYIETWNLWIHQELLLTMLFWDFCSFFCNWKHQSISSFLASQEQKLYWRQLVLGSPPVVHKNNLSIITIEIMPYQFKTPVMRWEIEHQF